MLEEGYLVLTIEGCGRAVNFHPEAETAQVRRWLGLLPALLTRGLRAVRLEQINQEPAPRDACRPLLEALGFTPDGPALERRRYQP